MKFGGNARAEAVLGFVDGHEISCRCVVLCCCAPAALWLWSCREDAVPQLQDISDTLKAATGWQVGAFVVDRQQRSHCTYEYTTKGAASTQELVLHSPWASVQP